MWPRGPFRTDGSPPACMLTGVYSLSSVRFQLPESNELLFWWCQKYCGDERGPDSGSGVLAPLCLIYSFDRIQMFYSLFWKSPLLIFQNFQSGSVRAAQLRGCPSTHNYTDGMRHGRKDDRKGLKNAGEDWRENKQMKLLCDSSFHI